MICTALDKSSSISLLHKLTLCIICVSLVQCRILCLLEASLVQCRILCLLEASLVRCRIMCLLEALRFHYWIHLHYADGYTHIQCLYAGPDIQVLRSLDMEDGSTCAFDVRSSQQLLVTSNVRYQNVLPFPFSAMCHCLISKMLLAVPLFRLHGCISPFRVHTIPCHFFLFLAITRTNRRCFIRVLCVNSLSECASSLKCGLIRKTQSSS